MSFDPSHQAFFNNGGLGIVIGDGQLPHPGIEQILEILLHVSPVWLEGDVRLPVCQQPGL